MNKRYPLPQSVKQSVDANKSLRGDGIVQHSNGAHGKTSNLSVTNLLPYLPKAGGGLGFIATLTTCPDNGGPATVTKAGTEETYEAYLPTGAWTHLNELCLAVAIETYTWDVGETTFTADYCIVDLVPWHRKVATEGEYDTIGATELAPYQLGSSEELCGGEA